MTATNWSWSATALPDAGIAGTVVDVAAGRLAGTVVTPVGLLLRALPARVEVIVDAEEQAPAIMATRTKDAMKATKRLPSRRGWDTMTNLLRTAWTYPGGIELSAWSGRVLN